jgi:hypothetical protein
MPQDLVGVIAFNRATDLTTDHEYVAQVVERIKDRHQAITYEILKQGLAEPSLCNDLRPEIQSSIDRLFEMTAPRIHSPRSVVPLLFPTVEFRSLGQTQKCTQWNRLIAGRNLLRVYAGIEYLRPVTGQKHLVVTTHGFFSSSDFYRPAGLWFRDASEEARLAARANDAEIALDVIDTFGTQASQSSVPFDRLSNMNLAALSGGQFSSLKTADDALRQLDASSRHSYLIGYAPSNASLDGKYRNVTVRVTRPGVAVAFRHGYTAQPETPPLDIQDIEASTRLRDAATSDMQQTDIKLDVTASMLRTDAGGRQVRVDVRIDGSRIAFTQNGARREGSLHLLILCGDKDQSVVGRIQHQLGMSLDDEKYHRALTEGMPYSAIVPISGIATSVKVVAYDYASDLLGSKVVTIK